MKDKLKRKKIDKEKIKKILVKVWFIISTILSVLFLLTLIIGGCQSNTKQNNTNSNSTNEIRSNRISRRIERDVITSGYYGFVDSDLRTYLSMSNGTYQTNCRIKAVDNNYYTNIKLTYTYGSGGVYNIALNYGTLNVLNAVKSSSTITSMTWVNDYYRFIYIESIDDTSSQPIDLNRILKEVQADNVTFNYGFNPINYMTLSTRDTGFFSSSYTTAQINTSYTRIFKGLFYCNGDFYDSIKLTCVDLNGTRYIDKDYELKVWSTNGWFYVLTVQYVNTISNNNVLVMSSDSGTNDGNIYLIPNSYSWASVFYQSINVIDYSNDSLPLLIGNQYTSYDLVRLTDNTSHAVVSIVDTGVFDFFGKIFSSMLPVLNVAILPGLTVGVLVAMPLIVLVVVLIIRMVKK